MIAIYSQDSTEVFDDARAARVRIYELYGDKIGAEAYEAAVHGADFRKHGGPLVQNISEEKAKWILEKERANNID